MLSIDWKSALLREVVVSQTTEVALYRSAYLITRQNQLWDSGL